MPSTLISDNPSSYSLEVSVLLFLNVKVEPVCSKLKLNDLIDFFPRRLAVPLFGHTQDDTCPTHTHVHTGHKQIERDVPEPSRKVAIVRNPPNYGLLRN